MEDKASRRKILLINPKFQLTMIGFNVGLAAIAIILLYLENTFVFARFTGTNLPELRTDPILMELLREDQQKMNIAFGITAGIVLIALSIGGLILSNRVAGPLYRLRRHMDDIASGKIDTDVKFREKDFFPELANSFNKVLERFRGKG